MKRLTLKARADGAAVTVGVHLTWNICNDLNAVNYLTNPSATNDVLLYVVRSAGHPESSASRKERYLSEQFKKLLFLKTIHSLDSLNDQIVQFILSTKASQSNVELSVSEDPATEARWNHQCDTLNYSMTLMRRLLVDAQMKFRKMMEDNKALASRIDEDIQSAHHQVSVLRAELADTNKRINTICTSSCQSIMAGNVITTCMPPTPTTTTVSTVTSDRSEQRHQSISSACVEQKHQSATELPPSNHCKKGESKNKPSDTHRPVETKSSQKSVQANVSPEQKCKCSPHESDNQVAERLSRLEEQNETLKQQNCALQKDIEELQAFKDGNELSKTDVQLKVEFLEKELKHAKEALIALKQDRKRLKAEKFDLLTQMKQLYSTLEDKENELREFIRNYEQKMKESDENLKQLVQEREESEKDKWNILKHAREEAERSVVLCTQLGLKDAHIKQLQEELNRIREKGLSSDQESRTCQTNGYWSPSSISMHTHNGRDSSNAPTPTPGSDPTTSSSYAGTPTITIEFPENSSPKEPNDPSAEHRPSLLSRSAEEIYNTPGTDESRKKSRKLKDRKGTWGSISRVFSRSKQRKALDSGIFEAPTDQRSSWSPKSSICSSPLCEESYVQKLRLLEEAHGKPMEHWRAATVLAWLEITLDMPQYGILCAENIKSGKVLLELSESELEEGLGITNIMHRRKLRLAIDEHREPSLCPYPKICLMTHNWVVDEWLPSLALSCYVPSFSEHLVDGRVLDTLTKKDLEKYFGITRKFHQVSIIHAIHFLRIIRFDRQVLTQRRSNSENMDVDPLVWTNQRFIKWAKSIDLGEYAENLRDSGVHGALVVLEPSFSADTMATALGIPTSKNIIRRHLTTEWENLIQPARISLDAEAVVKSTRGDKRTGSSGSTGSLGRNFMPSYARRTLERYDKRRSSLRESLKTTLERKIHSQPPQTPIQRPQVLPLSPQRQRRTFSHSEIETITVTPV